MSVDFQIPLSRNDLMSCEGEHYVVKEVYSVVDLSFKIEGLYVAFELPSAYYRPGPLLF